MKPSIAFAAIIGLLLLDGILNSVWADDYRLHFSTLLASDHHTSGDYNERHHGIGLTWVDRHTHNSHTVMYFENSKYGESFAYQYGWHWKSWGPVRLGGAVAAATGYENPIVVAPFITLSFGPITTQHLPGAVSAFGFLIPLEA